METFDGIIGRLTLFGHYSKTNSMEKAIETVKKEGGEITKKEIEHFLQFRKEAKRRYLKLLSTPLRWVEVKKIFRSS